MLLNSISGLIVYVLERKQLGEKLQHLATFDFLTNLPNRLSFEKALEKEIARARRHNEIFAVLSIDLDNFKDVNDSYGHDFGDLLLQKVGRRIQKGIRKEDFIARIGGDEFIVILSEMSKGDVAAKIAQKIINNTKRVFKIGKHQIFITVSIGISVFPYDGKNRTVLFKKADIALYQAKKMGRNNYQFSSKK